MTGSSAAPVATVIITNYNYHRFVEAAVRSALDQTVPCQVVVVDDGSTDDSPTVLRNLAAQHPELRLIVQENGGQASAMNAGWREASCDIVFFLDGDDRLRSTAVAEVTAAFAAHPSAVRCQFRLQWIDGSGAVIDGQFPEPDRSLPFGDLRDRVSVAPDDIAWQPTSGNAFTAAVLAELMPIPEAGYRISADHYLSNLSPLHGPVLAIESPLGEYRVHGQNQDHRAAFDLARLRSILIRTDETRRHLIAAGGPLGLRRMPTDPDGFRSLTTAGMRLTSFRLDGDASQDVPTQDVPSQDVASEFDRHPFPADGRVGLIRQGVTSALARSDFSPVKRLLAVAWIAALGVAPRRFIPNIASRALTR